VSAASALIAAVAAAALWPPWPFGRDAARDQERAPTIEDLPAQSIAVDTQAPISEAQAKAMESYQLFIDLAGDDPVLQAEAMRRLADLQLETSELEQLQRNLDSVQNQAADAIQLYEALLTTYPAYEKNDLVLYQLARAYELGGDPDRALSTLDHLVFEYPDTPHFAEAQFRRGEILFVQRRYFDAEAAYAAVLSTAEPQFREQSLYKHAWSLFKQLQHRESLDSFFELLDRKLTDTQASAGASVEELYDAMGRADQELVDDTIRVLSINFSYIDGPRSVTEYFENTGVPPYAYVIYQSLGSLYLEKERYQDAAAAYQAFGELDPHHLRAPLLQAQVIEAYQAGGFAGLVLEAKQVFVERYGVGSPYWATFSFEDQPEVTGYLQANLMDLAAYYHARAQGSGGAESYALAARWYRDYLAAFPNDTGSAHTNFLLAEVLYESGDHLSAVTEYERTAYAYPDHAESAEAGYAALLAYRAVEPGLNEPQREPWQRRQIDSALRFAATFPQHSDADAVLTNAAEKLFSFNELYRASEVARELLARTPAAAATLQRTAWTVVAHSEFELENFADAEAAYLQLMAFLPADDAQRDEITERIASSIYRQGEQQRSAGDYLGSVAHFLRVAEAAPGSRIVATARYDAAADLMALEDWPRAAQVLEDFRRDYPEHEYSADASGKLAVAYLNSGNSVKAAAEFEQIADADPSDEVRKEALWRAAELYRESELLGDAAVTLERYVERYPRPAPIAIEAQQQLVDLSEQSGNYPARMRWLRGIVDTDAGAGAERTDRTRFLAAHAALELAMPSRDAFTAVKLAAPLQQSLELKKQRMEDALSAFGRAVDYGVGDVTTAATYEIAELYNQLSRDLIDSERPAELSELELSQYEILLEEQAFPFEEQAIDVHEVNAARTADGVYDDAVRASLEALAELLPVRYAKNEQGEVYVAAIQ
jgi:TolA-binding protein